MDTKKFLTIFTLPIMWVAYFIFETVTGRVDSLNTIMWNLVLILIFTLIGYIFFKVTSHNEKGLSTQKMWIIFIILMIIDQGIKIIINNNYFDYYKEFLNGFLSFNPIINTQGSWLNARFGASVSFSALIFLNIVALLLFLEIYRYTVHKGKKDIYGDLSLLFILSGALCSLIDKIFYGGSLDFIGIGNLFIADIKDIYINLGMFFLILSLYNNDFFNNDTDSTLKEDLKSLKRFFSFIKSDIKNIFIKK